MFLNVWGIHFDPAQGKPQGEPSRVTTFENPGLTILTSIRNLEMSIDENRLYLPITAFSGSIWTLSDVDR